MKPICKYVGPGVFWVQDMSGSLCCMGFDHSFTKEWSKPTKNCNVGLFPDINGQSGEKHSKIFSFLSKHGPWSSLSLRDMSTNGWCGGLTTKGSLFQISEIKDFLAMFSSVRLHTVQSNTDCNQDSNRLIFGLTFCRVKWMVKQMHLYSDFPGLLTT